MFKRSEVDKLLAQCHRCCCICHRFCGVKIETDHILPSSEGGNDNIENAIPVCFECHAEIHAYNHQHPRGRKFTPEELREHKEQWLLVCRTHPEIFLEIAKNTGAGTLQSLIDELEYNLIIGEFSSDRSKVGCLFRDEQFHRAIGEGAISILEPDLKQMIFEAYALINSANQRIQARLNQSYGKSLSGSASTTVGEALQRAQIATKTAHEKLLSFLVSEDRVTL